MPSVDKNFLLKFCKTRYYFKIAKIFKIFKINNIYNIIHNYKGSVMLQAIWMVFKLIITLHLALNS